MENKKNTILLTVIAVATLLVAVVGATFAYFTASGAQGTTGNVTVSTGTAASSEFGVIKALNLYADASTFAQGGKDVTGETTGSVKWTAPGATQEHTPDEAERSFCYTAALNITANTFTVSAANTEKLNELEFTAKKGSTVLLDKVSLVDLDTKVGKTGSINIPTTAGGSEYTHKLIADAGASLTDEWTITVTLKNLDMNQNENTGKQLTGQIAFTKVSCA
ncbi:MAG: hypothetical protein KIC90_05875 [Firmicutes bacterium]|jgi:hypothetical protein|nr:hypothetical protein [Bacillota bacterium]